MQGGLQSAAGCCQGHCDGGIDVGGAAINIRHVGGESCVCCSDCMTMLLALTELPCHLFPSHCAASIAGRILVVAAVMFDCIWVWVTDLGALHGVASGCIKIRCQLINAPACMPQMHASYASIYRSCSIACHQLPEQQQGLKQVALWARTRTHMAHEMCLMVQPQILHALQLLSYKLSTRQWLLQAQRQVLQCAVC